MSEKDRDNEKDKLIQRQKKGTRRWQAKMRDTEQDRNGEEKDLAGQQERQRR